MARSHAGDVFFFLAPLIGMSLSGIAVSASVICDDSCQEVALVFLENFTQLRTFLFPIIVVNRCVTRAAWDDLVAWFRVAPQ
ncbi:MAG TPA: hypothetical protein P5081_07970 [Phycisphaerae bacterium]|nr:hypothetical protein [Phycisphaerae bacterium]HRW52809.1 hypothetical protein [Phycisphaerae bacterium]